MGDEGKKIDEVKLDWQTSMIVRYHSDQRDFTVVAGDESFRGDDLKLLLEKGRVHLSGWGKLTWEPVIRIDTEVYTGFSFTYRRCFMSKHKGKTVFRAWKIGKDNECEYDRYDKQKTGHILEGEPGEVLTSRSGRIIPFTADRWLQIRGLSKALQDALEAAELKLSQMLKRDDIDSFLKDVSVGTPKLTFSTLARKD